MRAPIGRFAMTLCILILASTESTPLLKAAIDHTEAIASEIKDSFVELCKPTEPVQAVEVVPGDVPSLSLKSCVELCDAGLETF